MSLISVIHYYYPGKCTDNFLPGHHSLILWTSPLTQRQHKCTIQNTDETPVMLLIYLFTA